MTDIKVMKYKSSIIWTLGDYLWFSSRCRFANYHGKALLANSTKPGASALKHIIFVIYGFHRKLVCLTKTVKVTNNNETTTP
jgi:hypothetical protein